MEGWTKLATVHSREFQEAGSAGLANGFTMELGNRVVPKRLTYSWYENQVDLALSYETQTMVQSPGSDGQRIMMLISISTV